MLLEKLKKDRVEAMKNKNTILRDLLGIVLTNITVEEKKNANTVIDDTLVLKILKKELKQVEEVIVISKDKGLDFAEETEKQNYLQSLIPAEKTFEETEKLIKEYMTANNLTARDIGKLMAYGKENWLNLSYIKQIIS